jgi:hypothetical protein
MSKIRFIVGDFFLAVSSFFMLFIMVAGANIPKIIINGIK